MPSLLLLAAAAAAPPPAWARSYIATVLHLTDYRAAVADLNDDGRPEVLVLSQGPDSCGSGGCDLSVLMRRGGVVQMAANISLARAPIRVLSARSHGWHDLGVLVAGGGITSAYTARLRFDGRRYPGNPSVPPARPVRHPGGRVVIDTFPIRPAQLTR